MNEREIGELMGQLKALKEENNHLHNLVAFILQLHHEDNVNRKMEAVELAIKYLGPVERYTLDSLGEVLEAADKIYDHISGEDELSKMIEALTGDTKEKMKEIFENHSEEDD